LKKYRRIEVKAFRRRVTIVSGVSGEWSRDISDAQLAQIDDGVSLNDTEVCEPVEPDSPEGQLLLVEAVRSLEQRLSPEARATIRAGQNNLAYRNLYLKLQSFYRLVSPKGLGSARKEK
jgi:hypothetical protein